MFDELIQRFLDSFVAANSAADEIISFKTPRLTLRQSARIGSYVRKWTSIGLSTEEVDNEKLRIAVARLYQDLELAPPTVILCESPPAMILAARATCARLKEKIQLQKMGEWFQPALFSRNEKSARRQMDRAIGNSLRVESIQEVRERTLWPVRTTVATAVRQPIWQACQYRPDLEAQSDKIVPSAERALRLALDHFDVHTTAANLDRLLDMRNVSWYDGVRWADFGQHAAHWCAFYDFLRNECELIEETNSFVGAMEMAKNAGWFIPFEKICFVSKRPKRLSLDTRELLHNEHAQAVEYPDGWSVWAIDGHVVPGKLVQSPDKITAAEADAMVSDEYVHNLMMEKMGVRYYLESGAKLVDEDHTGSLYRLERQFREDLSVVVVTNSTAEPDGSFKQYLIRVPPDMKTAHQAVAWTFNLTSETYAPDRQT